MRIIFFIIFLISISLEVQARDIIKLKGNGIIPISLEAEVNTNEICYSEKIIERVKQIVSGVKGCYALEYRTKTAIKIIDKEKKQVYVQTRGNEAEYELIQDSQVGYTEPKKIAILYIATGRYIYFWEKFYENTEKYFLPRHKKTYFLFTDHDEVKVGDNVKKIHQEHLKWPSIALLRYHILLGQEEELKNYDYIYFMNGTLLPIKEVNEEIFPSEEQKIMVTWHPSFYRKSLFAGQYERNPKSVCFVSNKEGTYYLMSGFNGGIATEFLKLSHTLKDMTDTDLKNNIIPRWHDESVLNKWFVDTKTKPLLLMPLYPEWGFPQLEELREITPIFILEKRIRNGLEYFRS